VIEDAYEDPALQKEELAAKYSASKNLTSAFLHFVATATLDYRILGFDEPRN
jgi:hypothetical protein